MVYDKPVVPVIDVVPVIVNPLKVIQVNDAPI